MNELILLGKVICLFIGIAFGFINVVKATYGHNISQWNNYLMSAGITGFITLQWLI